MELVERVNAIGHGIGQRIFLGVEGTGFNHGDCLGLTVLISDAPEGQVPHYVMRAWGSDYGGRHYSPRPKGLVQRQMRKLIIMAPHPDPTSLDLICHVDDAVVVKAWPEVLTIL